MDSFFNEFAEHLTYDLVQTKDGKAFKIYDKKFFPKEYIRLLENVEYTFFSQFEDNYDYVNCHLRAEQEEHEEIFRSIKDIFREEFSTISIGEVVCVVSISRRESVHNEEFEVKRVFKSYIEAKDYYLELHNNKKWYEEVRIDVVELQ